MTTQNMVDVGLKSSTGTGTFVGSISPSITTPVILGSNGFNVAVFADVASTTDYFNFVSGINNGAYMQLISSSSTGSVGFYGKGAGVEFGSYPGSGVTTVPFSINNGTHRISVIVPALTADRQLTIRDSSGTLAYLSDISSTIPVTSITGLGTGVATALAVNVGSAGAFTTFNGAGGTPSSLTLTNATGLPVSTGISGLGSGVATALALAANGSAGAFPMITSGSWTPSDGSGASLSFSGVSGSYVRIGNVVIAVCGLTYPATVSGSTAIIAGLPFTSATNQGGTVNYSTVATLSRILADASNTTFHMYTSTAGAITNVNMSGSVNIFQIIYTV